MNLLAVSLSVLSTISQSDQKGLSPSKDIALNPGPQEFQSDFLLHGHNNFRHEHATADLAWNTYLVNGSQNWTDNCDFEHSVCPFFFFVIPSPLTKTKTNIPA